MSSSLALEQQRRRAFGAVRILFGLIWLINTWLQFNPVYVAHFLGSFNADWVSGQPDWVMAYCHWMATLVQQIGPQAVAYATVGLDAILAVALLTGLGLPYLAWVGALYNLWLWSTVGGFGGPYTQGATDPGTAIIYALCFLYVIWSRSWEGLSLNQSPHKPLYAPAMHTARILFGLLWAFDAFWKWQPYFLDNAVTYLQQALPGEPAWIAAYISFVIAVINLVGPVLFGYVAAIMESVIAFFLLIGRGLRWIIPVGIAYSFGVWTTAEGWGAPYLPGSTANKGDVLGTTNIYIIAFLFLAAWVYFTPRALRMAAGEA
ncbi:hypothetical protein HHS34_004610 [Acidithiobacillus montserratensis]|uniref:Uncharacterized protein n=1 Tax=Acidithiobacillus montserratensis TaxID=2729135 RepID=A0ACD5HHK5_9PROT|nr:hypothetical protein [Acidithiobacillus montserratensis]MBN2679901.1 hypothetical protein [Acidithiobacillaceae bacterium]MBU2746725.1 hypothetical protein [Acidithiobacillus montserratensis]